MMTYQKDIHLLARCAKLVQGDYTAHEFGRIESCYENSLRWWNKPTKEQIEWVLENEGKQSRPYKPEHYERELRKFLATGKIGNSSKPAVGERTESHIGVDDICYIREYYDSYRIGEKVKVIFREDFFVHLEFMDGMYQGKRFWTHVHDIDKV